MEIHIDEEATNLLDKYCRIRPSKPELIVDRIVREWYSKAAKQWIIHPRLIPKLPKIPEGKTTAVNIDKKIAKLYILTIANINKRLNMEINPVCLTSWLCKIFFKAYNIKYMTERYKERFGRIARI